MKQETIKKIYEKINQLHIELEADPTVLGPVYINGVISKCRNHLNEASRTRIQLNAEKRQLKREIALAETGLAASMDHLLAEDETVRRQPNVRDREAVARTLLSDEVRKIGDLKLTLLDLETVEHAVKLIHEELIRTSSEIKAQRSMLNADRVTGAGYGDEMTPILRADDDLDERDLEKILSDSSAANVEVEEVAESDEVEEPSAEKVEPEGSEVEKSEPEAATTPSDEDLLNQFLADTPSETTPKVTTQAEPSSDLFDDDDFFSDSEVKSTPPSRGSLPSLEDSDDDDFSKILQSF